MIVLFNLKIKKLPQKLLDTPNTHNRISLDAAVPSSPPTSQSNTERPPPPKP